MYKPLVVLNEFIIGKYNGIKTNNKKTRVSSKKKFQIYWKNLVNVNRYSKYKIMFKKENREISFKTAETIIGPAIKVKGNFHGQGNIIIEGMVEGSVKTSHDLLIGNKARITANVEAKEAKVGGEVSGNIKVKGYLEILPTAKIFGDVEASLISIAKGAVLNGKCTMTAINKVDLEKNKP